jgi:hypothetical protein
MYIQIYHYNYVHVLITPMQPLLTSTYMSYTCEVGIYMICVGMGWGWVIHGFNGIFEIKEMCVSPLLRNCASTLDVLDGKYFTLNT